MSVMGSGADASLANQVELLEDIELIEDHLHSKGEIYPRLADPILITAPAVAWAVDALPTEIIPADTVTDPFDLHWGNVSDISANGWYQILVFSGEAGSEIEIAAQSVTRSAAQSQEGAVPLQDIIVPANTRISVKLASSNAGSNTARLSLSFHRY